MIGGLGNDTYVVDNAGDVVTEGLNEGTDTVQSSISYMLGANVENLTLTGSANLNGTGNGLANTITGNSGNNTLDGLVGADTMIGGLGNDTYVVDNAGDVVTEALNEGTDTVQASITYALTANVENLTLTGSANINGTGNSLANTIIGNSGNNTLDGGAGADSMTGGLGNDTYVVDNAGDVAVENANEGIDTVQSSISFTLGGNIENLTLTGSGNINGTGNTLDNTITGNSGNNTLDGGTGADSMSGGAGNDTYVVDDAGDTVTEALNEGTDTVQSSLSFTLGANVENLTLTGGGNINGTGNSLANTITGNGGNNTLDGGTGADTMTGGLGNDTYVVDNAGDVVTEALNEGADTVQSSISYALTVNVENLTLTGSASINGTGNDLANTITGNSGNNTLDGGIGADILIGAAGDDTLIGGTGNDTLNGQSGHDTLTGGAGADTFAFDASSLIPEQAGATVQDRILDYNQGNTGTYSLAEDDTLDLSALLATAFGSGQLVSDLVRVSENSSGTAAFLQIDQDGALNGSTFTTIAQLDGIHTGDSLKVILDSSPAGTVTLIAPSSLHPVNSFDGDSKSDILWQSSNGTAAVWLMDGTNAIAGTAVGSFNPGPSWHVKGSGDFNGDGKSDILWQNDNGTPAIWLMDGTNPSPAAGSARPIRGRAGRSRAPATSTATASPTSCGRTTTARRRSG